MSFHRRPFFNDRNFQQNQPPIHSPFFNARDPDKYGANSRLSRPVRRAMVNNHGGRGSRGGGAPRNRNDNAFGRFNSLEEFKNFRRSLKKRRSIEEESFAKRFKDDKRDGMLFVSPDDVLDMKVEIQNELQNRRGSHTEIEEICRKHARLHYYLCFKDNRSAQNSASRKPCNPWMKWCIPCDHYFPNQMSLDSHYQSGLHTQVLKIFESLKKVGLDYLALHMYPQVSPADSKIAEETGILVNLTDEPVDYSDINVTEMDQESFVLAAYEKKMQDLWPQPNSQFFCRSCNYSEFASQELLDRHLKSARHLDFERHYNEAFCIPCQHHYGDSEQMQKHTQSVHHKNAVDLMEFTRSHATHYWNLWHSKKKSELPDILTVNKKPAYSSNINSTRSNNTEVNEVENFQNNRNGKYPSGKITLSVPFVDNDLGNNKYSCTPPKIKKTDRSKNEHSSPFPSNSSSVSSDKVSQFDSNSNNKGVGFMSESVSSTASIECKEQKEATRDSNNSVIEISSPKKDPTSLNLETYESYINTHCIVSTSKNEKENEEKDEVADEKDNNSLDEYIVPLTGFMCTVCHETLADTTEAVEHQVTECHKAKVKTHKSLFG